MDKSLGYHGDIRNHKTPEHDEMCMFIHDNIDFTNRHVMFNSGEMKKMPKSKSKRFFEIWSGNAILEDPIKFQKNNYSREEIIGYIDVSSLMSIELGEEGYRKFSDENWFYDEKDFSITKFINYEIKPKIESVGDVIRQIKYYKEYLGGEESLWVVVTKTKGLRKYFESQGIVLVEYEDLIKGLKEEEEKMEGLEWEEN